MSIKLTAQNFESVVLNSDKPVFVDFWAKWCGPCKMISPVIEQLSEELEGKVVVAKLDVDEAAAIAVQYGVMSIPTMVVFENGKEVKRTVGFQPKERLKAFIGV